jgi:hypothetical protein
LCFPFFSYLPFYWGLGLAIVFIARFAVAELARRSMSGTAFFITSIAYTTVFGIVIGTYTGVERVEEYECGWKLEAGNTLLDLRAAGNFGWARANSAELTAHLKKNEPSKVQVKVPIVRDFGRVRARGRITAVDGFAVREP